MTDYRDVLPAGLPRPGRLDAPEIVDRIEVRISGQPNPMVDDYGREVAPFPPYDFTWRSDSSRHEWQAIARIAALALAKWTDAKVELRRVRVETRASAWVPVDLDALGAELPEVDGG